MKHVFPNCYSAFKCRAGACRHTCCAGWEIDIDPVSLQRFKAHPDIIKYVDVQAEDPCFRLRENDVCPFLNADGLCEMIIAHGEGMLCDICADHPRFMNYLSDREETGLGLCCEAAADLILNYPQSFALTAEDDGEDDCELTEDEMIVLSIREDAFAQLSDRSRCVSDRIGAILDKAQCPLPALSGESAFSLLSSLERMDPAWDEKIAQLRGVHAFTSVRYDPAAQLPLENLAYYFFYRHLLPACEDGEFTGRLRLCAFLWYTGAQLITANGPYDSAFAVDVCRQLSCEIEYSDENITRLIQALDAQ